MYLSREAAELLTSMGVDATKLEIPDPNDHTVDVLGRIAEEFARHQTTVVEALHALAAQIQTALAGSPRVNPLGTGTEVRRHDEAFYAMQALRPALAAAVAAWKQANTQTTKEAGK